MKQRLKRAGVIRTRKASVVTELKPGCQEYHMKTDTINGEKNHNFSVNQWGDEYYVDSFNGTLTEDRLRVLLDLISEKNREAWPQRYKEEK